MVSGDEGWMGQQIVHRVIEIIRMMIRYGGVRRKKRLTGDEW